MATASAAVAEYKTKVKLFSIFQRNITDYATAVLQLKNQISDLEAKIESSEKKLFPSLERIETLKQEISNLVFLYQHRNNTFEKISCEIENIIFDYSRDIDKDNFSRIIENKKIELEKILEEISNIELNILKKEQEKLARINDIQDDIDRLNELKQELKFLKNRKDREEIEKLFSMVSNSFSDPELEDINHLTKQDNSALTSEKKKG
ncbi:hypothetical protein D6779_11530 [Candidatus Parcubacteria bacterium]|nr:MAG: hypothetical protein D6779_11530 [Candidatus Parcubacteria bacterium]